MTTRSDSDECLGQNPLTSEKASIFRDGFAQDSLKVVSLPPLEKDDSVGEMMSSKKQVKSSPFASVLKKYEETIHLDTVEASFSKEPEAMYVYCHGVCSVPETTSAFLEADRIGEELERVKETSAANVSEVSKEGDDVHKMEADGSFVCSSEKKGQEDSDVQRHLEAEIEKKDVETLANVEKNGNGCKEQHQKVERVRVKDNAFVGRSVNIDLVDDTALLNVVPFSKKAKDHPKDAARKHKRNGGRHIVGGKQQTLRIMYSINQMKSMRYAHSANQKKLWSDMYARLMPELVTEYEGLVSWKNQKTSKSNMRDSAFDPVSAVPRRNHVNIFVH